jgi:hypothetical protein
MRSKAGISESDNSELDDVSVSPGVVWSDRISDPRTVNRGMGDARAASFETTRVPGGNVDRLG